MSANRDTALAWQYHNANKHSHQSIRRDPHFLDWANQPRLFKVYRDLEPIQLDLQVKASGMPALEAVSTMVEQGSGLPDLAALTQLMFLATGITRRRKFPGGEISFRTAACTGALYEFELYVVSSDLPGLPAGVYHFHPGELALRRLRAGDHRGLLVRATGGEAAVASAPVILVFAGTYWRNAWKYRARTYRHFGWDNGTILGNLLAASAGLKFPARVVMGFVDAEVNHLLGLDAEREVAFSLVALGHSHPAPPEAAEIPELHPDIAPLSAREVDYAAMRAMHAASSLLTPEEVSAWRGAAPQRQPPPARGQIFPLEKSAARPPDGMEEVILRRGSTRRFAREPITLAQLSVMLDCSTRGIAADFLLDPGALLNDLYVIVHAVEGLPSGSYFFRRDEAALEALELGDFRLVAGYLGLEQELPADAAVAVFFLADLPAILERFGNRGYRAVQLEAGILGGKLYLAAYAQRLGATGLTFYDDEVAAFFSPHAQGKSTIFLMALGKPRSNGLRLIGSALT